MLEYQPAGVGSDRKGVRGLSDTTLTTATQLRTDNRLKHVGLLRGAEIYAENWNKEEAELEPTYVCIISYIAKTSNTVNNIAKSIKFRNVGFVTIIINNATVVFVKNNPLNFLHIFIFLTHEVTVQNLY